MFKNTDYSILSKILHHIVLGNNFIPELFHDIETIVYKNKLNLDNLKPHVFICGLPRSGTTILMKSLYDTDRFASLTYRDMPFIIAPNLWSKISNKIKSQPLKERMHGDNIHINIDSPEALEEIFWKVKLQKKYIYNDKLVTHEVDEFTINEFKNIVSLILYKYKKELYLSKNNNNLLRLESIIKTFPNCLILIPFRDPFQQAKSLLTQHQNFLKIQKKDKFIKKYMSYLVHYEFGAIHRPYELLKNKNVHFDSNSLEYWLNQWLNAYTYLSQEKFKNRKNVIYINYEHLCNNPKEIFKNISKKINLNNFSFNINSEFKLSYTKVEFQESTLTLNVKKIFDNLKTLNEI